MKYAEAAYTGNPDCQVYVFANYPQIGNRQERKDEYDRWDQQLHEPRWPFGASRQMKYGRRRGER